MVKQIVSDAVKQARDLARQAGVEALKIPGEVVSQGAKSVGFEGGLPSSGPSQPGAREDQPAVDQQLAAARARMRSFSAKQTQGWQGAEVQGLRQDQKRVQQIVETQLGQVPQGEPAAEAKKEQEKKGGLMGALSGMFKGRKSRRMGAAGQAKRDSKGEYGKGHQ